MNALTPRTKGVDPFERLRRDIDHLFDRLLPARGNGAPLFDRDLWEIAPAGDVFRGPSLDIAETDKDVVVTAELPGMTKDDFTVEVVGDRLALRGEKKSEREETKEGVFYSERSYGAFSREVQLPSEVLPEKATSTFKDGILTLTLPKPENARPRRVKVNVT